MVITLDGKLLESYQLLNREGGVLLRGIEVSPLPPCLSRADIGMPRAITTLLALLLILVPLGITLVPGEACTSGGLANPEDLNTT
jgi:hypothetical protein